MISDLLGGLVTALSPSTHADLSALAPPVLVDMAGHRLPFREGLLTTLPAGAGQYRVVFVAFSSAKSVGALSGADGETFVFSSQAEAAEWCRYLIEAAHAPDHRRKGAIWLMVADYPGGARFEQWLVIHRAHQDAKGSP